jgi:hypothetical protein
MFVDSLSNINLLLVLIGIALLVSMFTEIVLVIRSWPKFRGMTREEVVKRDLIKIFIKFLLTLFFSYALYIFIIKNGPNLKDPLAFIAVSMMIYFGAVAICRNIRYLPLILVLFGEK